jgi:DNA ligase (NAD+)
VWARFDWFPCDAPCSTYPLCNMQAATRGDGTTGEDVTYNIHSIAGLPAHVPGAEAEDVFSVRGEVYIALADFQAVNTARAQRGEEPFSNARNAAVGSLRHSDPVEVARRKLRFVAFELIHRGLATDRCSTQMDAVQQLASWGFATLQPYTKQVKGINQAIEAGEHLLQQRNKLPFQVDGYVLKLNDLQVPLCTQLLPLSTLLSICSLMRSVRASDLV